MRSRSTALLHWHPRSLHLSLYGRARASRRCSGCLGLAWVRSHSVDSSQLTSLQGLEHAGLSTLRVLSLHCHVVSSLRPLDLCDLASVTRLNLSNCGRLPSLAGLGALPALVVLNMPWCRVLTSLGPLIDVPQPALKFNLSDCTSLRIARGSVPAGGRALGRG